MYTLGIETSCDETSAAVVKDGKTILSNVVASSLRLHKKYGGIVPEIAFRKQLETISCVTQEALDEARVNFDGLKLICVTKSPGLMGSLLVGVSFAKAISYAKSIPLLGVDHLHAHMYANMFAPLEAVEQRGKNGPLTGLVDRGVKLPCVALVVSGGHTSLFCVRDYNRIELLGATQDDACGEAFDKVAKILNLGYPGGPVIEQMAKNGDPKAIKFNCSDTKASLNFSFSGIKTAVLYYVNKHSTKRKNYRLSTIDHRLKCDICASFQDAVINVLINKSLSACRGYGLKRLVVGGGVAANVSLRDKFFKAAALAGIRVYFPAKPLCMDNAAMIAGFGFHLFKKGETSTLTLTPSSVHGGDA